MNDKIQQMKWCAHSKYSDDLLPDGEQLYNLHISWYKLNVLLTYIYIEIWLCLQQNLNVDFTVKNLYCDKHNLRISEWD